MDDGSETVGTEEAQPRPDLTRLTSRIRGPLGLVAIATGGLFLIALFAVLHIGRAFFLPVVLAVLLKFLLTPALRALKRLGLPAIVGSTVILICLVAAAGYGAFRLSAPVAKWVDRAPHSLSEARVKLEELKKPVEAIRRAGAEVEKLAEVGDEPERLAPASSAGALSETLFDHAWQLVVGGTLTFFLLYFLLASDDMFLRKLARVLPSMAERRKAVVIFESIERDLSRYMFVRTLMNAGFGTAVGIGLWLLGMPNPVLWGLLAGILNYVPYLGGLVGYVIVGFAAVLSFDTNGRALLAPGLYFALNVVEGNIVAPYVLGRHLQLNPVMIFVFLMFWGWVWGIPGLLLAIPLMAAIKIVADNVSLLSPIGEFLGR